MIMKTSGSQVDSAKHMENLEIFPLREFIFFNARLRRLAAASALEATSIQTFEISEAGTRPRTTIAHPNEAGTRPRTTIAHPHRSTQPRWAHHAVHGKCLTICNFSTWRNRVETISLSQYFTLNVCFFVPAQHVNSSPAMGDSTRKPRLDPCPISVADAICGTRFDLRDSKRRALEN